MNKEGVYMVFEGFCGIYEKKKKPLPKKDAFGKEIMDRDQENEEESKDEGATV